MVTDEQVRRYFKLKDQEKTKATAAAKAGMDEKTARKYERLQKLPGEITQSHYWQTRTDPFSDHWESVKELLVVNPGLEAKTVFTHLQRKHPGKYQDGQLRTLQRRFKVWHATEGPGKEVFFAQNYVPGERCQSDFTHMRQLGVTIGMQPFDHMLYHFVLPYSNWETGMICFSESFESISEGLQAALWKLGGVPKMHQTDRLSAAINNSLDKGTFTDRYEALLRHYSLVGRKIQAGKGNENGDIEQRNRRFKNAVDQSLMLRGSRNFNDRTEYASFLKDLFMQLNAGRSKRFKEEQALLRRLPLRCHDSAKELTVRVGPGSAIRVNKNYYSVHSRLIKENVKVRLFAEYLEVWYAQKKIEVLPRLRGEENDHIQYRHIIDWLVRKPGAFAHYKYRHSMFPNHWFRMLYDHLKVKVPGHADKQYLRVLHIAAHCSETKVTRIISYLLENNISITVAEVENCLEKETTLPQRKEIQIAPVELFKYDQLLKFQGVK